MPEVSRFYGIVIQIYFGDHLPRHFHARYGGASAKFDIDDLSLIDGKLPTRACSLVIEWATLHQEELRLRLTEPPIWSSLGKSIRCPDFGGRRAVGSRLGPLGFPPLTGVLERRKLIGFYAFRPIATIEGWFMPTVNQLVRSGGSRSGSSASRPCWTNARRSAAFACSCGR